MQYMGGKSSSAARLSALLVAGRRPGGRVVIPFAGGLSDSAATARLLAREGDLHCLEVSDAAAPLMGLYRALREGWVPDRVDDASYPDLRARAKAGDYAPQVVWAGIACSFGGKWMAGLARNAKGDSYHDRALRSIRPKLEALDGVPLLVRDFRDVPLPGEGDSVYLDFPYLGTQGYPIAPPWTRADSEAGWAWAERAARAGAFVIASEYAAPPGWVGEPLARSKLSVSRGGSSKADQIWRLDSSS